MELSECDVTVVLDAVVEAAAAADERAFATRILAAVERLVPSDVATYNVIDLQAGAADVVWRPLDALGPEPLARFAAHVGEHPLIVHFGEEPQDGRALSISDFVTRRELHATGLYGDFFRALSIEDQLAINLPVGRRSVVGIAVNRPRATFTARERARLEMLRPAVARAVTLVEERRRAVAALRALERGLEASGAAVVLVTGGRVDHMSPRAAELLGGRLPHAVASALSAGLEPPALLEHCGRRLALSVLHGDVSLLLVREQPAPAHAHGLTARELTVLEHVRDGLTDREIAEALGVSPRTVHRHLQNVYAKLGVRRRTAAVARVFST